MPVSVILSTSAAVLIAQVIVVPGAMLLAHGSRAFGAAAWAIWVNGAMPARQSNKASRAYMKWFLLRPFLCSIPTCGMQEEPPFRGVKTPS